MTNNAKSDLFTAIYAATISRKIDGAWNDNDIAFICDSIEALVDQKITALKEELLTYIKKKS